MCSLCFFFDSFFFCMVVCPILLCLFDCFYFSLDACLYSDKKEKGKECRLDVWGREENLEVREVETVIKILYEIIYFQ